MKIPFFFRIHQWFLELDPRAHVVILIFLGFCVYANAIGHPFVHDDTVLIVQNPDIARWDNIGEAFLKPSTPGFFPGLVKQYYRPVLEIFSRLQYALFGFNPHGFHFFNIVFHILNGLLMYAIVRRIISPTAAFAAAVVFVVHPVQSEAVACISGISNVLCCFFILLSLYFYQRQKFLGAWAFFAVALFTKEQAVILPGLIFLYEWLIVDGKSDRRARKFYPVFVMITILTAYLVFRHGVAGGVASGIFENLGEMKLRLLTIPGLIETYIGILVFPFGLHYYRSVDILAPYVLPIVILLVLGSLIVFLIRRSAVEDRKTALFGLGWFLVSLLPVLNIVPLINEYSFLAAGEHNLYLPIVGFLIFMYAIVRPYLREAPGIASVFLFAVIFLSVLTVRQNESWGSEVALFKRACAFEPQLGRAQMMLGHAYLSAGKMDEALSAFDRAHEIMAGYARKAAPMPAVQRFYEGLLKDIYFARGQCFNAQGNGPRAIEEYNNAIMLFPDESSLYTNRAFSLLQMGKLDEGMADLKTALEKDPQNLFAANNLSICYIQKGDHAAARRLLIDILEKAPDFQAARDNLKRLEGEKPAFK